MFDILITNSIARFAFLALLFAGTMLLVFWIGRVSSRRMDVKADIRAITGATHASGERVSLQDRRQSAWGELADRVEKAGISLGDTNMDALRERLLAAGFTSEAAPRVYTLVRLVLVFVLPLLYAAYISAAEIELSQLSFYFFGLLTAVIGLYLPTLLVRAKADRRREEITNGFPDCLDLMLVCVEAGLGLEAAMDRVGRELVNTHPLIARILSTATLQMRAGAQREDALRQMGERSGVQEVKSFATLLIQSDKLGTSIADTLRVYAEEMREKRRLRAEEKAYRLPVLISIPLVVCMLPVMIGVMLLPGLIRVVNELMPVMGGG